MDNMKLQDKARTRDALVEALKDLTQVAKERGTLDPGSMLFYLTGYMSPDLEVSDLLYNLAMRMAPPEGSA